MSEHEFEQFLAIFRGLLRLNPAQRDEIAAELMDHLQERLAELTARGMSRDRAVQTALEEFGDAAGLAAQFLLVVSQQRRRRIMKWTAGSVMAAMVVLYGAYAFWPATPARGPGFSPAVAQNQSAPTETKKKKKDVAGKSASAPVPKSDATQEVEMRLAEKMASSFVDVPLQEFLDTIGAGAKVDFYLDKNALEDAGVGTDKPVTINLRSIRIDKLLDLALGQLDLVWISRDGYVFVTTREKLEQELETRVYNCRDLIELSLFGSSSDMAGAGIAGMMPGGGMPGGMMSGAGMMPGSDAGMGAMGVGGMSGMSGMSMGGMSPSMGGLGGVGMGAGGPSLMPYMGTLIQVITTTVMPESWAQAGGSGSVAAYHNGLLVVNHHPQAHRKVEQLLRMLREASKDRPGAVVREH